MTNEELLREIAALPKEAKRQIEVFLAFLRDRYEDAPNKNFSMGNLKQEEFVGMWRDRTEMQDSSAWVREVREKHWSD